MTNYDLELPRVPAYGKTASRPSEAKAVSDGKQCFPHDIAAPPSSPQRFETGS